MAAAARPRDGCSARPPPAVAHARQGGAPRVRGGGLRAPSGRARAAVPDTDGDGHDAPRPRPGSSSAPARLGGSAVLRRRRALGGFPCFFLQKWERPSPRKPRDSPAHAPRDQKGRRGGGGSVPGAATDGGPRRAAHPLGTPLPSEAGASQAATSRPDPGAPGPAPLQRRARGCTLAEGSSSCTC